MSLRRPFERFIAPLLIAGILTVHFDGCAATSSQYGIADPRGVDETRIYRISTGTEIELTRRDGVVVRGRFRGTARMASGEYARHWSAFPFAAPDDSSALPPPGTPVEIRPRRGGPYTARLAGFALNGVEIERDSASLVLVAFSEINEIRGERWTRTGAEIQRDAILGRVPLSTVVRLGVANGEVEVPADRVAQATLRDSAGSTIAVGIIVGVLAAVAGAFLAVYLITSSIEGSCGSIASAIPPPMGDGSDLRGPGIDFASDLPRDEAVAAAVGRP